MSLSSAIKEAAYETLDAKELLELYQRKLASDQAQGTQDTKVVPMPKQMSKKEQVRMRVREQLKKKLYKIGD